MSRLATTPHRVIHRYRTVPLLALEVGTAGLAELTASSLEVESVVEDALSAPPATADRAVNAGAGDFDRRLRRHRVHAGHPRHGRRRHPPVPRGEGDRGRLLLEHGREHEHDHVPERSGAANGIRSRAQLPGRRLLARDARGGSRCRQRGGRRRVVLGRGAGSPDHGHPGLLALRQLGALCGGHALHSRLGFRSDRRARARSRPPHRSSLCRHQPERQRRTCHLLLRRRAHQAGHRQSALGRDTPPSCPPGRAAPRMR